MGDHIILVDFLDREIGYEEKMKAHVRPMLHRAFSVLELCNMLLCGKAGHFLIITEAFC